MAYSIHGHISWILETSSERPNDFSLIRKKPSEILEFTWKKLMLLKFKSNLNSKFMLKGSKTIKIMKKSKSRRGLTQIKVIFFAYKKIIISIYRDNKAKRYCFWLCCTFWASCWHIDCKINWERTFIEAEPFIQKTVSFWDSVKKFKTSHRRQTQFSSLQGNFWGIRALR